LWFLARMVNQCRTLLVLICTEFMRRIRWNIYQDKNRLKLVGKYLEVF
jgi:hypothetical protein